MNEHVLRPRHIAAAIALLAGAAMLAAPQYATSIARISIGALAAAAGLHLLLVTAPPTWWLSPFDRRRTRDREPARGELDALRRLMSGRRQRIAPGVALPPGVLRILKVVIASALERAGIDEADTARTSRVLSLLSRAVLAAEPLERISWTRTLHPHVRRTAALVQRVLDETDRITHPQTSPTQPGERDENDTGSRDSRITAIR